MLISFSELLNRPFHAFYESLDCSFSYCDSSLPDINRPKGRWSLLVIKTNSFKKYLKEKCLFCSTAVIHSAISLIHSTVCRYVRTRSTLMFRPQGYNNGWKNTAACSPSYCCTKNIDVVYVFATSMQQNSATKRMNLSNFSSQPQFAMRLTKAHVVHMPLRLQNMPHHITITMLPLCGMVNKTPFPPPLSTTAWSIFGFASHSAL